MIGRHPEEVAATSSGGRRAARVPPPLLTGPDCGVFGSSDGGRHWHRVAHDVCGVASSPQQRIVVADLSRAYAGPHSQTTFFATTDGGRSWQQDATLPVGGSAVNFTSGTKGYAISSDGTGYFVTADGGSTWRQATFTS